MKKLVTLVALLSLGAATAARAETREDVQNRLDNAALVLHQIMAAPDKGIPEEVLEHAKCIAVVPHMIKGGFVFGAENGKGVATCRTAARMERTGVLCYYWRKLGIADRRRRRGSGHDLPG